MWIQLRTNKQVPDKTGRPVQKHKGDWVEVGKQTAMLWLSDGSAVAFDAELAKIMPANSGMVMSPSSGEPLKQQITTTYEGLQVVVGEPHLPFTRTVLWNTRTPIRHMLFAVGLAQLSKWQVAIPLFNHKLVASQIGNETDRNLTAKILPDLRVPVYQTDLIFVKKSKSTIALIELWLEECKKGDARLAWLRALYEIKPLYTAFPASWWTKGDE